MKWTVTVKKKLVKQLMKLPVSIQERFDLLAKELEVAGPVRSNWKNFGKLKTDKKSECYHCHIKAGKPTYVVCWEVTDKKIKLIEVYYAGTHENAPY
ncbi:MAG: cytotoxic translational repressor of toxin-antitoxin stability system [Deltaproteobacteria bacterium]|nr:cytotoxic translational repressor of toxin-antitoxin stability system [Deltaproteobacteria bacterium]